MSWQELLEGWIPSFDIPLFRLGDTTVTVATLITASLIVVVTLLLSRLIRRSLDRIADQRSMEKAGTVAVTARLIHYTVMFVGVGIALNTAGIDLTALFAAGAVFAVALGFAMQTITQNFVSGVILLFERSIKPNDIVEVEGQIVRIKELGIRSTIARSLNEEDLIIPNSILVQSTVRNYTLRDSLYRIDAPVGVVYSSDLAKVRQTLEATARGIKWQSKAMEPVVLLSGFGSSSVDFMVSVWMENPWQLRKLRSDLNEAIWWALKKAEITIAFPQLDVHFDPPVERSLAALASA